MLKVTLCCIAETFSYSKDSLMKIVCKNLSILSYIQQNYVINYRILFFFIPNFLCAFLNTEIEEDFLNMKTLSKVDKITSSNLEWHYLFRHNRINL